MIQESQVPKLLLYLIKVRVLLAPQDFVVVMQGVGIPDRVIKV